MGEGTRACRGVVAAGHTLTAEAGALMLHQGGNAFDAAIAAVMTAWVTESMLTSAGGGGFLLAHTAAGESCLFDFFTQTPRHNTIPRSPDFYPVEVNFGDTVQEFHIGMGSMAVPGCLAGLFHIHQRLGRLPLAAIAEPAIYHARHGVRLNPFMDYCLTLLKPILLATESARSIYAPQGTLLTAGDTLRMPALADTLERLIHDGAESFYEGAIAQHIARDCEHQGGYLTMADFTHYRVIERCALQVPYHDTVIVTNPPPSSGGALIAFTLKLLDAVPLAQMGHGSEAHLATLAEAMALTNEARRDGYDRRLYEAGVAEAFLATDHLAPYQAALQQGVNKWGSTTHVSVLDAEGNAASVTTSNGEGSAYCIPHTDIMVNNMLGEEDLHPHGFHRWQPNQRISSMMAPTIVLQGGKPRLVLGSGGSNRIRTAILQVISNVLDFEMAIADAVAAPRIHWERGTLHLEPGYDCDAAETSRQSHTETIVHWQQPSMFFGGVHGVAADDGTLQGAGDHRRGGAIAIA
ncbi:MAG: gamma-glutamyltransferase [Leptolyngbyaceae cyanobacterium T60_A2020_046]|nr:gamma-glutamyltransferase [Leptolyngbyaceae cyanobacterium T60_A2020_046]